jgi:hypothetical protein
MLNGPHQLGTRLEVIDSLLRSIAKNMVANAEIAGHLARNTCRNCDNSLSDLSVGQTEDRPAGFCSDSCSDDFNSSDVPELEGYRQLHKATCKRAVRDVPCGALTLPTDPSLAGTVSAARPLGLYSAAHPLRAAFVNGLVAGVAKGRPASVSRWDVKRSTHHTHRSRQRRPTPARRPSAAGMVSDPGPHKKRSPAHRTAGSATVGLVYTYATVAPGPTSRPHQGRQCCGGHRGLAVDSHPAILIIACTALEERSCGARR